MWNSFSDSRIVLSTELLTTLFFYLKGWWETKVQVSTRPSRFYIPIKRDFLDLLTGDRNKNNTFGTQLGQRLGEMSLFTSIYIQLTIEPTTVHSRVDRIIMVY